MDNLSKDISDFIKLCRIRKTQHRRRGEARRRRREGGLFRDREGLSFKLGLGEGALPVCLD